MRVLVIGGGGREHALCWKLSQSSLLSKLYCAPGNAGIAQVAECAPAGSSSPAELERLARELAIDLSIVGPEQPLVDGIVDLFQAQGRRVVGPTAAAARLEGSKIFAKEFMSRHDIPTARFEVCDSAHAARAVLQSGRYDYPLVLKADGLAAGKGVIIAATSGEAEQAIAGLMELRQLGAAGDRILIEECLQGREASFLLFGDGRTIRPLVAAQDYKRAFDNDQGPNTGGMGTFSTPGQLSETLQQEIIEKIAEPTIRGAAADGFEFRGILFIGLMLTSDGPKVIEYNVRFGDPETQTILTRLNSDLLEICDAIATGTLGKVELNWSSDSAVCVVAASAGYPGSYGKGKVISGLAAAEAVPRVQVFHAGTSQDAEGSTITSGGRVLGVTARGKTLSEARQSAYAAIERISFDGMFYRRDIAL